MKKMALPLIIALSFSSLLSASPRDSISEEEMKAIQRYVEDEIKFIWQGIKTIAEGKAATKEIMLWKKRLLERVGGETLFEFSHLDNEGRQNITEQKFSDYLNGLEQYLPKIYRPGSISMRPYIIAWAKEPESHQITESGSIFTMKVFLSPEFEGTRIDNEVVYKDNTEKEVEVLVKKDAVSGRITSMDIKSVKVVKTSVNVKP